MSQVLRTPDLIVLYLGREHNTPPLPVELQPYLSEGDWSYRLSQTNQILKRSSAPIFERIWFGLALVATLVVPIVLYDVLFNTFARRLPENSAGIVELRAIGAGIFVGTIFVFWAPLAIWKGVTAIRIRKLTNSFAKEDAARGNPSIRWQVYAPGVFGMRGRVTISTPPPTSPSVFDPNAGLPEYIAPPQGYFEALDVKEDVVLPSIGYGDAKILPDFDQKTATQKDFEPVDFRV